MAIMSVLLFSCKDEVVYVLDLESVTNTDESISIHWGDPKIDKFNFYQVMRSTDGKSFSIISTINSALNTTFTDNNFPLVDSLIYKVVAVGSNTISSKNLTIKLGKKTILNMLPNCIAAIPGQNKIVMTTNNNGYQLSVFDLDTKTVQKAISINYYSDYNYFITGKYNGESELYYYEGYNNKVTIYNASTLESKMYYYIGYMYSNPEMTTDKNGNIYLCSSSGSYIHSFNRQNSTQSTYVSNGVKDIKYDSISNTLLAVSSSYLYTYDLSATGTLTLKSTKSIPYNSSYTFVENGNYLFDSNNYPSISVYDYVSGSSYTLTNSYPLKKIYYKNGYFYAINSNYSSSYMSNAISCYQVSNMQLKKSITTKAKINSSCMIDNKIVTAGNYNINYTNYYLLEERTITE
ncbi:MAG: hypothetical protein RIS29_3098 [Bacteroidota bacterium]